MRAVLEKCAEISKRAAIRCRWPRGFAGSRRVAPEAAPSMKLCPGGLVYPRVTRRRKIASCACLFVCCWCRKWPCHESGKTVFRRRCFVLRKSSHFLNQGARWGSFGAFAVNAVRQRHHVTLQITAVIIANCKNKKQKKPKKQLE